MTFKPFLSAAFLRGKEESRPLKFHSGFCKDRKGWMQYFVFRPVSPFSSEIQGGISEDVPPGI